MVRTVGGRSQNQVHTMLRPQIVQTVGASTNGTQQPQMCLQPQAPLQAVNVMPLRQAHNSSMSTPTGSKGKQIGADKILHTG